MQTYKPIALFYILSYIRPIIMFNVYYNIMKLFKIHKMRCWCKVSALDESSKGRVLESRPYLVLAICF